MDTQWHLIIPVGPREVQPGFRWTTRRVAATPVAQERCPRRSTAIVCADSPFTLFPPLVKLSASLRSILGKHCRKWGLISP